MGSPHVGDIGVACRLTVKENGTAVNISTATTKQIIFRKPSGEEVTKTAAFTTDGSDGKIQYVTLTGDLDEAGDWEYQGYVVVGTFTGYTDIVQFKVMKNI